MKASEISPKLIQPFKEGIPLPYQAFFNSNQFALLKNGLTPRDMDDKWVVYYEEPHLFVYRAGTMQPWYRVTLRSAPDDGIEVTEVMLSKDVVDGSGIDHIRIINIVVSNLLRGHANRDPVAAGLKKLRPKRCWWRIW